MGAGAKLTRLPWHKTRPRREILDSERGQVVSDRQLDAAERQLRIPREMLCECEQACLASHQLSMDVNCARGWEPEGGGFVRQPARPRLNFDMGLRTPRRCANGK